MTNHYCYQDSPVKYATPPKRNYRKHTQQEEDDRQIQILSPFLKKTYSVPSTIDSPLLAPRQINLIHDMDSSYELQDEEELPQECSDYHQKGYCQRGKDCTLLHSKQNNKVKKSCLIENFPELMGLHNLRRVRSFLE